MEIMMYKDKMIGIATGLRIINRTTEIIKKTNRNSLPFHPNDLNFIANNGISVTIKAENPTEDPIINHLSTITVSGFHHKCKGINSIINGMDITQRAVAGVGTPLKLSVCLVSTLNLANRNAEKTGMASGKMRIGCSIKLCNPLRTNPVETLR